MVKKSTFFILILLFIPIALGAFTLERELFSEAESRYFNKNYAVALECYNEFVKKFPLSDLVPDAYYRRALCLFRLERYDEALKLLKAIGKRYRTTRFIEYVPFWKGVTYFQLGDYVSSKENLEIFLKKTFDPDLTPKALLHKALCCSSSGNFSCAMEAMAKLIDEKGYKNVSPYEASLYSYILLKERAYDELIGFQEKFNLDEFPDEWREKIYLYIAEAYWQKKNSFEAEKIYKIILTVNLKTASTAYRRLYLIAQQKGDFSEMEWIIQKAEEKFSESPEILKDLWLRIGIESFKRKELELAKHFLKKVWNIKNEGEVPETVPLYLAEIYIKNGEMDSARKILEEYLGFSKEESGSVILRLGNIYLISKNYSDASEMFLRFIEKNPSSKQIRDTRYLLAYSKYKSGEFDTALEQCFLVLNENKGSNFQEDPVRRKIIHLKALILKKQGKIEDSYDTLKGYVNKYPDDIRARLDLVKLLFTMKDYKKVVAFSNMLSKDFPDLEKTDIYTFLLSNYLCGLSQVSLKSYKTALHSFSKITDKKLKKAGIHDIFPYTEYYRGWALYRLNDFDKAVKLFLNFITLYPSHELYDNAFYLCAWCYFSMGNYKKAHELFSKLSRGKDSELSTKAQFLDGKSLLNLNDSENALKIFYRLYTKTPKSIFADDALFEYAGILGKIGKIEESADSYLELWNRYPDSPLSEEALYKRGEIYFSNTMYEEAKNAFRDYRIHFSEGKSVDASLYWQAFSAYKLGEVHGASLIWEMIINSYNKSPFRPDAIKRTAEIYITLGNYKKASDLYTMLINSYPDYSRTIDAEIRLKEVQYLIFGLDRKEAELTAVISSKGGVDTKEGREAMIELSRIYIFEEKDKLERAFQLLNQVIQKDDIETSSEAQFLLGEYYFRKDDLIRAGKEFYKASLKNPMDRDFMAYSILRAAQMMKLAGKTREMEELVKRLEKNFPQSEWTKEGKKLLEDIQ